MKLPTIYLAGGMFGLTTEEASGWRNKAKQELRFDYNFLDPMRRDYRNRVGDFCEEIVTLDKKDIDNSDILLVMAKVPSWGTAMEILYGWENKKEIISIVASKTSPWVLYHSTEIYLTLPEALYALMNK